MDEMMFFQKNALLNNLCGEWKNMWKACKNNKEKLVRLSLMQQSIPFFASYCYNGNGLSKDYILGEFKDYINGKILQDCDDVKGYSYRLFVGYTDDIRPQADVTHLMWSDIPIYVVERYKCPILYISNKSTVSLIADGYNYIRVYLFDESELVIEDLDEESTVIVYKYSDKCKVTKGKYCLGKVNQFEKTLRL
jgi:hypothetical protein